jgi:ribulose-5-phosphate 4-epimerase/fuculose-1-phosphate aldolase
MSAAADQTRSELALGCRILDSEGLGDYIWGHASARAERDGTFWLKGAGLGLDEIGTDDLILLDLDGNVLEGDRPRHVEWPIHAELYRARPDVMAVVHSHAPATVAFGCLDVPLAPVCHEAIRWMPPPPRFTETSDLIDSPARGAAVAQRMGEGAGVLLRNHGFVNGGAEIRSTILRAVFLERACRTHLACLSAGVPFEPAPAADVEARREKMGVSKQYDALWAYFARHLG